MRKLQNSCFYHSLISHIITVKLSKFKPVLPSYHCYKMRCISKVPSVIAGNFSITSRDTPLTRVGALCSGRLTRAIRRVHGKDQPLLDYHVCN